jgi:hypothetical protein
MIPCEVRDGSLYVEGRTTAVPLPARVRSFACFSDTIVVCTERTGQPSLNVFGVDRNGLVVWQIAEPTKSQGMFLGINPESSSVAIAVHDSGLAFYVDVRTGRTRKKVLFK